MPGLDQLHAQRVNEGALAHSRHTRDADAQRLAGMIDQGVDQLLGPRPILGQGTLHECDGSPDCGTFTGEDCVSHLGPRMCMIRLTH